MADPALSMQVAAPLRLGLVGLGRMGRRHLKAVQGAAGFTLAALMDSCPVARDGMRSLGVPVVARIADLVGLVDVVIIASTSSAHHENALPLLAAGIHCLVEKPLAVSLDEIEAMQAMAARTGAVLAVGHSERFNPVVMQVQRYLAQSSACRVSARRWSQAAAASQLDLDVVQDLLVHDLDWLMSTLGHPPRLIRVSRCIVGDGQLTEVRCTMGFGEEIEVDLQVSRIAAGCERRIELHDAGHSRAFDLTLTFREGETDPLGHQLASFHDAIHGRQSRIARAEDAWVVMAAVEQVRAWCYQAA